MSDDGLLRGGESRWDFGKEYSTVGVEDLYDGYC